MKRVERSEILDWVTYGEQRDRIRAPIFAVKAPRRIHVGDALTFLFENTATVRDQIQEMVRVERMVKESDILHEISTYNELLGAAGQLGATLLIEIEDPQERDQKLTRWHDLLGHLYLRLPDERRVRPSADPRQIGEARLSAVHYLKFETGGQAPLAVGVDHPELSAETPLTDEQRAALAEDLA